MLFCHCRHDMQRRELAAPSFAGVLVYVFWFDCLYLLAKLEQVQSMQISRMHSKEVEIEQDHEAHRTRPTIVPALDATPDFLTPQ